MKIGGNDVTRLYVGGAEVNRVYVGAQMVYDATPAVPMSARLWVGDYDATSVTVSASLIEGATDVVFAAVPASGPAITTAAVAVDPTYAFARTTITGLAAGTEYQIQARSVGGAVAPVTGAVKTRPTTREAFTMCFASCHSGPSDGSTFNHPIFEKIWDDNPGSAAFIHLGDRGYGDIGTNNVALYHAADDDVMSSAQQSYLHRRPTIYVWDDHDYGPNDSGASAASRPAALAWYRSRVPARPHLTGAADAIYRTWSPMPGVVMALLDGRSERVSGSLISDTQEAWLINLIETLPADSVLVFATVVPWIGTSTDAWSFATAQRTRIGTAISTFAPGRVIGIAGDAHMLAYGDGSNSVGGIPICQAAPLARPTGTKGGPYTIGPFTNTPNQYGRLDFTPAGDGWSVRFRGFSLDAVGVATTRIDTTAVLQAPAPPASVAPTVTTQASISGTTADTGLLTVNVGAASGSPAPSASIQWRRGGVDIAATGATLDKATFGAGVYSAVVTWTNGTAPNATSTSNSISVEAASGVFTPTSLFSGNIGWVYDASDLSSLFQDQAGTVPVTEVGQPIGFQRDLSGNNLHRTAPTDAQRPILQMDENGKYYLLVSSSNSNCMATAVHVWGTDEHTICTGMMRTSSSGSTVYERSPSTTEFTGAFSLTHRNLSGRQTFAAVNKGTTRRFLDMEGIHAEPGKFSIMQSGKLSAPFTRTRINGVSVLDSTSSLGSTIYGEHSMFFFGRNNTSLFSSMREYTSVGINRLLTDPERDSLNAWTTERLGAV